MRPTLLGAALGLLAASGVLAVAVLSLPPQPPIGSPSPPPIGTPGPTSVAASPSPTPTRTPYVGTTDDPEGVGLAIGEEAPPLRLPRLGGGELDLASYRQRPVWVNFMASWCPPCIDELPMLQKAQRQLADAVRIVLVDVGDDEQTARSFVDSVGVTLPVGLDTSRDVAAAWRAYAMPVHIWLDAEGIVRAYVFGGAGPDQFNQALQAVAPGATFTP